MGARQDVRAVPEPYRLWGELTGTLGAAGRLGPPITFRTAGTSLSGQAITDSVLVLLANAWRGARVLDDGERISLEPGVMGAKANAMLASCGRKIGPDPASINAAMIGGIAANNAAGTCCGTAVPQLNQSALARLRRVRFPGPGKEQVMKPSHRAGFLLAFGLALLGPGSARAENGVSDTEVVFGMSAPFSGTAKEYGRQLRLGFEMAFAEVNGAGGIHGRQLRLVAMDDAYEVARALTATRELVERHKVFAVVSQFGTASCEAVLPYVLDRRVLFFAPYTGASSFYNDPPDRYVFTYRPSYKEETAAAVRYLVNVRRLKPSQIAVFQQNDNFGDSGFTGVAYQVRQYRLDPSKLVRVIYPRNTIDVDGAVNAIKQNAKHLRAVVMVANYRPAAKFIEKLRAAGLDLIFTNVSVVAPNELAEQLMAAGPKYADGVIVTQVVPLPMSRATATLRYQTALKRFFPAERPDYTSLEAWIEGNVLAEALRRAGRDLTTEGLVDALESIRGLDLGLGTAITYGPSEHTGSRKIWGTMLDSTGKYRAIDLE